MKSFKEYIKEKNTSIYNIPATFLKDVTKRLNELGMYIVSNEPYTHMNRAMQKLVIGNTTRSKLNQLEMVLDRLDKK